MLSNKEKARIKDKKVLISKFESESNLYLIQMALTEGQLLSIKHALETHSETSSVGKDVFNFIMNALELGEVVL